jgi:hypothetical protein
MGRKEVFNGVTSGVSMLGLFYKVTAQEFGEEKTIQLCEKLGEDMGASTVQELKKKIGDRMPTMKELKEALNSSYNGMGFTFSSKAGKTKLTNKVKSCPFYDGFAMAGIPHETISKICKSTSNGEYKALMNAYPQLTAHVEPKKSPDDFCVEAFKLKRR